MVNANIKYFKVRRIKHTALQYTIFTNNIYFIIQSYGQFFVFVVNV